MEGEKLSCAVTKLAIKKGKLAIVENDEKKREKLKQAFVDLNELVASLLGTLFKTEQGASSTQLGTLVTAENILKQLKKKKGYLLALNPVSAGGSYRIRRKPVHNTFHGRSPKLQRRCNCLFHLARLGFENR